MIHGLLVLAVGLVLWYYDNDIRRWVKRRWGGHIRKVEGKVEEGAKKIYDNVLGDDVNNDTDKKSGD